MTALAMEFGEFDLPQRNSLVMQAITACAAKHAAMDATIGLFGFLPVPGAGPAALVAALIAQVPVYQSLVTQLAAIYETPHDDIVRGIVNKGMAVDTVASIGAELVSEFGVEFFREQAWEILQETSLGFVASFIPILGGFASTGLDVVIAITMTWRVGTMVSIYYQNGGKWVESRRNTYKIAKGLTGGVSAANSGRVDLNSVPWRVKAVGEAQVQQWMRFVSDLIAIAPTATDEMIVDVLTKKGVELEQAKDVVRRVRGKRAGPSPESN
jgi:hypothetical protein